MDVIKNTEIYIITQDSRAMSLGHCQRLEAVEFKTWCSVNDRNQSIKFSEWHTQFFVFINNKYFKKDHNNKIFLTRKLNIKWFFDKIDKQLW